jgi:hypothetical protein
VEIVIRFGVGGADNGAFDANLAFQLVPEEHQCSARVCIQLARFTAAVVGEEGEAPIIDRFEKDHAGGGSAAGIAGGEGHGRWAR